MFSQGNKNSQKTTQWWNNFIKNRAYVRERNCEIVLKQFLENKEIIIQQLYVSKKKTEQNRWLNNQTIKKAPQNQLAQKHKSDVRN